MELSNKFLPSRMFHKAIICETLVANLTAKTLGMPATIHCLNDTSHNEISAFAATGGEKYMEIMLAVFTPVKLMKNKIIRVHTSK